MKAIGYTVNGAIDRADALIDLEVEKPTATGHDILVKVEAVSVNPIDTKIRQSRAAEGGTPVILGWDAVGEVVEIGDKVSQFKTGDKVWYAGAINRPGTNAEYHLVDARIVGHAPKSIETSAAAAEDARMHSRDNPKQARSFSSRSLSCRCFSTSIRLRGSFLCSFRVRGSR